MKNSNRNYFGHESQLYRVEEHRLIGGKGDNMRLFEVNNGSGLEFTICADRSADISRLSYQGINLSYFSVCGYAAPTYSDKTGLNFLKSFNCGFLTTCGVQSIGSPSEYEGTEYGLHGTMSHTPADQVSYDISENGDITVTAKMTDACIFNQKISLVRPYHCAYGSNELTLEDIFKNEGSKEEPFLLLYHMNMGYPLLSESSLVDISSAKVVARNEAAEPEVDQWNKMIPPVANYDERCFYHTFEGERATAKIYNPDVQKGLAISFDPRLLPDTTAVQNIQDQGRDTVTDHHGIPDTAHAHMQNALAEPQRQETEYPQSRHIDCHGHFRMSGSLEQPGGRIIYSVGKAPQCHHA